VPVADVPVTIAAQAHSGNSRFDIRLDPPDLGRIDVQLSFDGTGNVNAHLIVERSDTLDILRRDAPQLDRTLQNAGLNTGDGAQYSLADQGFANRNWYTPQSDYSYRTPTGPQIDDPSGTVLAGYAASTGRSSGLDITV
jgi:flagellar hook-length control protein FliK